MKIIDELHHLLFMVTHALFYIVSFFKQILMIDTLSIACVLLPWVMATGWISLMIITAMSDLELNIDITSGIAYGN